jgi:hypothetical protein
MPAFNINPEINLGHILTLVTLVVGLVAVYFQARSTRVSEKQLQLRVRELGQVVERLDAESKARERIESTLTQQQIDRLTGHADQMNYTTWISKHYEFMFRQRAQIERDRASFLALSLAKLAKASQAKCGADALLQNIHDACTSLINLMTVQGKRTKSGQLRIDQWDREFDELLIAVRAHDTREARQKIEQKQQELVRILSEENLLLERELEEPAKHYKAAVERLTN